MVWSQTTSTLLAESRVRQDLLNVIRNDPNTIEIELHWHFLSFLADQYEASVDVELQQVICCSGVADNAFAAPCVEYAELQWPRLGKELIQYLSRGIRRESAGMCGRCSHASNAACS